MNTPARPRLIHDLKKIANQKPNNIQAMPVEDNLLLWTALIEGPEKSVWDGGVFYLKLRFTDDYPFKAPRVNFMSKMFHPNVYNDGRICLDMLQQQWNSVYDVWSILTAISILLSQPNHLSPANAQASKYYTSQRNLYEMRARELVELSLADTTNYQEKAREELKAELEEERIRAIKDEILRKEDEEFEQYKRRKEHQKQQRRRKRQLRKLEEEQRRFQNELKVTRMASRSGPPPFYRTYRQYRPIKVEDYSRPIYGMNETLSRNSRNDPNNPIYYKTVPTLVQKKPKEEEREEEEQEEEEEEPYEEQPEDKSEDEQIEDPEPCPSDGQEEPQEEEEEQNQDEPKEEEDQMDENQDYEYVEQGEQNEEQKESNSDLLPSSQVINLDSSSQAAQQPDGSSSMLVHPSIEHIQPEQPQQQQQEEAQPEQSSEQLDLNDFSNQDIWFQQALFRSIYRQYPKTE